MTDHAWMSTLANPPASANDLWTWACLAVRADVLGAGPRWRQAIPDHALRLGVQLADLVPAVTKRLWDLDTVTGTELAQRLIVIQDAALLATKYPDLLTADARRTIQAWTEDANGVLLDQDATEALDEFLAHSPLPAADRIDPLIAPMPAAEQLVASQFVRARLLSRIPSQNPLVAAFRAAAQHTEKLMSKITDFKHFTWEKVLGDFYIKPSPQAVMKPMATSALSKADQDELSIPGVRMTLPGKSGSFKITMSRVLKDYNAAANSQMLVMEIASLDLPVETVTLFDQDDSTAAGKFKGVAQAGEVCIDAVSLQKRIENDIDAYHFTAKAKGTTTVFELETKGADKKGSWQDYTILKYGHYVVRFKGGIVFAFDMYKDN